jgi:hypothetical protein
LELNRLLLLLFELDIYLRKLSEDAQESLWFVISDDTSSLKLGS